MRMAGIKMRILPPPGATLKELEEDRLESVSQQENAQYQSLGRACQMPQQIRSFLDIKETPSIPVHHPITKKHPNAPPKKQTRIPEANLWKPMNKPSPHYKP